MEDKSDSEDEDDGVRKAGDDISRQADFAQQLAAIAAASKGGTTALRTQIPAALPFPLPGALGITIPGPQAAVPVPGLPVVNNDNTIKAIQAAINLQHHLAKIQADVMPEHYEAELEINDFPQNVRWKVIHKETLGPISEWTRAAITSRGQYIPPGKNPAPGERKLYLFIEGPNEKSFKLAKTELKRVLQDITNRNQALSLPVGGAQPGRYWVI